MEEAGRSILERVPQPISVSMVMEKHPVRYEESMNTVLIQEVIRYNKLLVTVRQTLNDLLKALKGLVVMSQALETMANSLYNNSVPELWASKVWKCSNLYTTSSPSFAQSVERDAKETLEKKMTAREARSFRVLLASRISRGHFFSQVSLAFCSTD